jgi:hypothetical protein
MATIRVEPCSEEYIKRLAPNLAKADLAELWAMERRDPVTSMMSAWRRGRETWALLSDDTVVAMYGVIDVSLVSDGGRPWNFSCQDVGKYAKSFIKESVRIEKEWADKYSFLTNYVDSRHTKAVRWIKWLGYTLDNPIPIGPEKVPFFRFWKRGNLTWPQDY